MEEFDKEYFLSKVESINIMPRKRLIFNLKNGSTKEYIWEAKSRKESWTPKMREQARQRALKQHKGGIQHA
ncbi:MAG: hypothetical protein J7L34_05260 [Thermotogaceae bacterium]|nr:hypothetical protein [Thermotogaceae bacterium]